MKISEYDIYELHSKQTDKGIIELIINKYDREDVFVSQRGLARMCNRTEQPIRRWLGIRGLKGESKLVPTWASFQACRVVNMDTLKKAVKAYNPELIPFIDEYLAQLADDDNDDFKYLDQIQS